MNLDQALTVMAAACREAEANNVAIAIAVVDAGGNLIAQQRMDDAPPVCNEIARNKAYTVVASGLSVPELFCLERCDQPVYGVHSAAGSPVIVFGGGLPVVHQSCIVGGIGVSGGGTEQDINCAQAGLLALTSHPSWTWTAPLAEAG